MPNKLSMRTAELKNRATVYAITAGIWSLFKVVRRFDPRFQKSLRSFDAVMEFRTGDSKIQLVFANGDIGLSTKPRTPDFVITYLDLPGVLKQAKEDPTNMLRLLLENKISKQGNNDYLFKFGFLASLCERFIRERAGLIQSKVGFLRA